MDVFIVVWAVVNALVSVLLYIQRQATDERLRQGLREIDANMKLVNTMRAVEAGLLSGPATRGTKAPCEDWLSALRN